ncbi:MAG: putative kinase inhibitor protein [bacterium ADurb.Bin236]|nr:MAG: putative kinase inhibitor protein [bacterium ADurb.Bin236]HOY64295.1 YbhB/YbcL family Raf kinase inhibitor-like protein [bacterium]HPN93783.1 YbhB/YbcL family Raf kinase inhibitor-like protein [bacterium]
MSWTLSSPAFSENQRIPDRHTCKGVDVSPELHWSAPPSGTVELALIMDDPDAPMGTWTHWTIYGISPDTMSLPENVDRGARVASINAAQGLTSYGTTGYGGPCPPPGLVHRYFFKLFALSEPSGLPPAASIENVWAVVKKLSIAETQLMGTFGR